jgi:ureidoglycolate dehydrogenase (NAD+)
MLSSLLSGAAYGTESGNMVDGAKAGVDGHFFAAVNVAFFEDPARFGARTDAILREVHGSKRRPGVERLYVPGEIEADLAARYRNAIPLSAATLDDIVAVAARLDVDPSPILA